MGLFVAFCDYLAHLHSRLLTIRLALAVALAFTDKEAWQKLFSTISRKADAEASMALMLEDARVRDSANWDWVTHGYGQSITQLVKVSAWQMEGHVRLHAARSEVQHLPITTPPCISW